MNLMKMGFWSLCTAERRANTRCSRQRLRRSLYRRSCIYTWSGVEVHSFHSALRLSFSVRPAASRPPEQRRGSAARGRARSARAEASAATAGSAAANLFSEKIHEETASSRCNTFDDLHFRTETEYARTDANQKGTT